MQTAAPLLLTLVFLLPFAWFATEFRNNRPLRITLLIAPTTTNSSPKPPPK